MMKQIGTLITCLLLALQASAADYQGLSNKYVRYYKPSEYNSDTQVWDISRGKGDDMYFATNEGVVWFDGVRWEKYATPDECLLRSVFFDADQNCIYSGGVNEIGCWRYDAFGVLQYKCLYQNEKNQPTKEFWRIAKVPYTHLVYFQSPTALLVYDDQQQTCKEIEAGNKRFGTLSLINQQVYVQQENLLYRINGYEKTIITDQLKDFYIIGMFPETEGRIRLVSAERGSRLLDSSGKQEESTWGIPDVRITSICQMKDNYLVGTGNSGFYVVNAEGKVQSQINEWQGLKNAVLSVNFNNSGDYWLGLNGGIMFVEESMKEESFLMDPHETIGYVYCAVNLPHCLYLGTNRGLYLAGSQNGVPRFELISSLKGQVWNLYTVNDLVVVAHNKGLFTIRNNTVREVKHGGVYTFQPIASRPGWYLSGNYNGFSVYSLSADGELVFRNNVEGYNNLVQECYFDKEGNLWLVHSHNQYMRLRFDDEFVRIAESQIYDVPVVHSRQVLLCNVDNDILFLDNEQHVYKFNELNNQLQPDEYYSSLLRPVNSEALAVQYSGGLFWQINKSGIGFLKKEYNKVSNFPQLFSKVGDAFTPKAFRKIIQLDKMHYAVGLLNGIGIIDVGQISPRPFRKPHVSRVEAVGQSDNHWLPVPADKRWEVPAHYNSIVVWLTSLSRSGQVEYRIRERNEEWTTSTGGKLVITYLSAGTYTVEMRSCDGSGMSSEVETMYLHVHAPWYASGYAWGGYAVLLLLLLYGTRRVYQWKTHQRELQIIAEEERKRKEELGMFQLTNLKEELENKNSKLMSITMMGVQNNTFLKKIKEDIGELLALENPTAGKMQLKRVIKEIDRQLNDQTGWNNFAEHFNNTCNGFFDKLNEQHPQLTNNDLRLCAYIRLNLNAKEIASLMNISTNSVEMAKYRLRKKLDMDESVTLNQYLNDVISNLETFGHEGG